MRSAILEFGWVWINFYFDDGLGDCNGPLASKASDDLSSSYLSILSAAVVVPYDSEDEREAGPNRDDMLGPQEVRISNLWWWLILDRDSKSGTVGSGNDLLVFKSTRNSTKNLLFRLANRFLQCFFRKNKQIFFDDLKSISPKNTHPGSHCRIKLIQSLLKSCQIWSRRHEELKSQLGAHEFYSLIWLIFTAGSFISLHTPPQPTTPHSNLLDRCVKWNLPQTRFRSISLEPGLARLGPELNEPNQTGSWLEMIRSRVDPPFSSV